jgi:GT2 family glycosyltransferase
VAAEVVRVGPGDQDERGGESGERAHLQQIRAHAGERSSVSVVVVTYDALPWLERCLDSVRGYEAIVVDHGSSDGSLELVRERFPEVRLIEQENVGMGGGNNAGIRASRGDYVLLLNSDAWVVGDAVEQLVACADAHPRAAVVGPLLRNPDGTLQRSMRSFPTLWRLSTEYLGVRKLAPRSRVLNPLYAGGFDHDTVRECDWLSGACLLVRRAATEEVGLFDEAFFMFSEETDWCYRFDQAGWTVVFTPGAEVVHVGAATHGGRLYRENLRSHLRFFAKHHGPAEAERARKLLIVSLELRALVFRGERGRTYRDAVSWLRGGSVKRLLESV